MLGHSKLQSNLQKLQASALSGCPYVCDPTVIAGFLACKAVWPALDMQNYVCHTKSFLRALWRITCCSLAA